MCDCFPKLVLGTQTLAPPARAGENADFADSMKKSLRFSARFAVSVLQR